MCCPYFQEVSDDQVRLYAVDPVLQMWVDWRDSNLKPIANSSELFITLSRDEFNNYTMFKENLPLIQTVDDRTSYFMRECILLQWYTHKFPCVPIDKVKLYGVLYYRIPYYGDVLSTLAQWVEDQK